jgi:hypothetical protein
MSGIFKLLDITTKLSLFSDLFACLVKFKKLGNKNKKNRQFVRLELVIFSCIASQSLYQLNHQDI